LTKHSNNGNQDTIQAFGVGGSLMSYNIQYAAMCHKGFRRDINQDNLWCASVYLECENEGTPDVLTGKDIALNYPAYAVFDGLGGEQQGEMAAYIAASNFGAKFNEYTGNSIESFLIEYCIEANQKISNYQEENLIHMMGTTAAILMCGKDAAYICNVGDSRVYRYRRRKLTQVSLDHIGEGVAGRKPPLTQCLGIPESEFLIEPYAIKCPYGMCDRYLICSDGLTDMLTDKRISSLLGKKMSIPKTTRTLVEMALRNGGIDNTTVILVEIRRNWSLKCARQHEQVVSQLGG